MGRERQFDGVRPASDSTIAIDFYYAGQRCRESIKLQPTPTNLKRAAQHRAAILAEIEKGTFDYAVVFPNSKRAKKLASIPEAAGLTVTAYLDKWLEAKKRHVKASTWDSYQKIVNRILIPAFGRVDLVKLRRVDVKNAFKDKVCSNKWLRNIQSVLRSALDEAVEDEILEFNPIKDYTYQNAETLKVDDDVDPFTASEQAAILTHCEPQFKNLIQFAFWTGLRTSELVALDWTDIDWKRGVVKVTKSLTQASEEFEDTKTKAGRREVKLLAPALEALVLQKPHTLLKKAEIFQNPTTRERWTGDDAIRRPYWKRALRLAGITYRRPYQTRHTYASMMLSAGEHPMWVAQQMGHSDWGMIRRTYGRFMPDSAPEAGNKAEMMFAKNVDQNVDQTRGNNGKC